MSKWTKSEIGVWASILLVLISAACALYGRLVDVERRLSVVEKHTEAIYRRLFEAQVAER